MGNLLSCQCSASVKRHCNHSTSCKGRHSAGAGLRVQGCIDYHHGGERRAWWRADWHGAGAAPERELYVQICRQLEAAVLGLAWAFEASKLTTSNTLPATRPHLLVLLMEGALIPNDCNHSNISLLGQEPSLLNLPHLAETATSAVLRLLSIAYFCGVWWSHFDFPS